MKFYNGEKQVNDKILKLSSSFARPEDADVSDVEVRVHLINIRPGSNNELLSECKPLMEYSWLIERILNNKTTMGIEGAVDNALDEMPMNFELRHFLTDHRAEVTGMLLKEYDEAKTMQMLKEEGREEGREEGLAEGTVKGMLETLNNLVQAGHITQEIAAKQAGLTEEEFNNRVKQLLD